VIPADVSFREGISRCFRCTHCTRIAGMVCCGNFTTPETGRGISAAGKKARRVPDRVSIVVAMKRCKGKFFQPVGAASGTSAEAEDGR